MTTAARYRKIAGELRERARLSEDRAQAAELNSLAASYLRLAEAADRNSAADIPVEFAPARRSKHEE